MEGGGGEQWSTKATFSLEKRQLVTEEREEETSMQYGRRWIWYGNNSHMCIDIPSLTIVKSYSVESNPINPHSFTILPSSPSHDRIHRRGERGYDSHDSLYSFCLYSPLRSRITREGEKRVTRSVSHSLHPSHFVQSLSPAILFPVFFSIVLYERVFPSVAYFNSFSRPEDQFKKLCNAWRRWAKKISVPLSFYN